MTFPFERGVTSEKETEELAKFFAEELHPGQVVVFNGELGTGKTFFIKNAVTVWGITDASSPSFAIVNIYCGERKIYHFDFYRLKNKEELFDIGFNDYINDTEANIFIEWGSLIPEILPEARIEVNINSLQDSSRKFRFVKYD